MFGLQLAKAVASFHFNYLSDTLPLVLGGVVLYWSGPRHFEATTRERLSLGTHLV